MTSFVVGAILASMTGAATLQAQSPAVLAASNSVIGGDADGSVFDRAVLSGQQADARATKYWVNAEYLLWRLNGSYLPSLVTASPLGTPVGSAGVLGRPGTEILFGNTDVNSAARSGGRLNAGYWFDCEQISGIEVNFFMLESMTRNFVAGSTGETILARPFFNTAIGRADAELVAFPGILNGSVAVTSSSGQLLGAGALFRQNLISWGCGNQFRLDGLVGYRYLHLGENLGIQENLTATDPFSRVPFGTSIIVNDRFDTRNDFHGGEVGLSADIRSGRWSLNVLGKIALGCTQTSMNIDGSTLVSVPGAAPFGQSGGFLAQISNGGPHQASHFSCVPELDVSLGYQLSANCRITAGYTILYWTRVARPGDQIDLAVNPNLLPPVMPGGDLHPAFPFRTSSLCVQGLSLGIAFRY